MTARKPDHLKLLTGTARADRVAPATPALPPIDAVPIPPAWLTNLEAVREWHRLAPVMVACKLLNTGNLQILVQVCALHGRLVEMWTAGATPTAALIMAFRKLSNDLGLTNIQTPTPAAKPNRFLVNRARE